MDESKRKLSRRGFLRLAGSAAATAAVSSACKPAAPAPTQAPPEPTQETAAEQPTAAAPEATKAPLTVIWWDSSNSEFEHATIDRVVTGFSKQRPEATVQIEHGVDGTKYLTAVSGGTPPDAYWTYENWNFGSWINKGLVQELDPYIQKSGMDMNRFVAMAVETVSWRKKVYGMPLTGGATIFWRNKKAFQEAGLDPEKPVATFDEWVAVNDKLTKKDAQGNITQVGALLGSYRNPDIAILFGNTLYDPGTEKLTCTDESFVKALQWQADWIKRYGADKLDAFGASMGEYASPANPFCLGQQAIFVDGEWLALIIRDSCKDLAFGLDKLPKVTVDAGPVHPVQGCLPIMLPPKPPHGEEGWNLMEYMMTTEASATLSIGIVCNCMVKDAINFPDYAADPVLKFALEYYGEEGAKAFPMTLPVCGEYNTELTKAWDLVVHGSATAEAALQEVYNRVQPELDKALGKA